MFKAYLLFTFVLGENCNSLKRWLIYIRVIGNSPVKLPFVWLRFSSLGFPKNCSPFLIFSMLETICSLLILWWKSTPRTFSLARLKMCSIHAAISISFYMCVIKSVHDASFPQRLFLPGGCPTKPLWPIRTSQPPLRDPPQQKTKKKTISQGAPLPVLGLPFGFLRPFLLLSAADANPYVSNGAPHTFGWRPNRDIHVSNQALNRLSDEGLPLTGIIHTGS